MIAGSLLAKLGDDNIIIIIAVIAAAVVMILVVIIVLLVICRRKRAADKCKSLRLRTALRVTHTLHSKTHTRLFHIVNKQKPLCSN